MFNLLHTYSPEPIAIAIGSFAIHWYGVFAAVGLVGAWFVVEKLSKQYGIKQDLFSLFFGTIIAGLIGARLYHVINEFSFYLENISLIPQVWKGGLALHGGILGAFFYAWYWIRKNNQSFGRVADIFATGGILIQIFGRFGNYFNQELFGVPTNAPWGIPIFETLRPAMYVEFSYFHPTFIYEVLLNVILFIYLLTLHKRVLHGKLIIEKGYIFLTYLFFYSVIRAIIEIIRIDTTPILFGVRLPVIVSFGIIVSIISFFSYNKYAKKKSI